jgi:hypothetical protein
VSTADKRRFLGAEDIAAEAGVPVSSAAAYMNEMTPVYFGKHKRVSRANYENWIRRREADAAPAASVVVDEPAPSIRPVYPRTKPRAIATSRTKSGAAATGSIRPVYPRTKPRS